MRLERPRLTERFGSVRIHELQRVIELDSGGYPDDSGEHEWTSQVIGADALRRVERDMVVVIPCMNESRRVVEGVLSGVPHDCLIVLVSNSDRAPVDRYGMESQSIEDFCRATGRPALAVHQRDPGLAAAVQAAGLPELLDETGLVRAGKGEAMLVGLALAALSGRRYLGYVDADNYVPGAVNEYCKAYAAGFALAEGPTMVRISWHSKPKVQEGRLFFSRRGRTSEVTNHFLNQLVAEYSGFGTEVIATGNAGEHALSLDLGMRMRLAGGFAVEPYQFLDLFEQFGGVLASPHPDFMPNGVSVRQIETRNPHFHANRGDEHVNDMRLQALNVLYHSPVCLPAVRAAIRDFMVGRGALGADDEPPIERVYPPLATADLDRLHEVLVGQAASFREVAGRAPVGVRTRLPILRAQGSPGAAVVPMAPPDRAARGRRRVTEPAIDAPGSSPRPARGGNRANGRGASPVVPAPN
jgi:mannosyl-3-phosphoglycerate synthase